MKMKITAIIILFVVSNQLFAGSIWAKRNSSNVRSPYTDEVARKVGDILTIQIQEDGKIENKVDRALSKDTTRETAFTGDLGITTDNTNLLPRMPGIDMTATSNKTLTGNSEFNDERKITDEIAVVVEDVLPNGNLVVVGSRFREVAGDKQEIRISGIVRPTDISYSNTVNSEKVANFQMVFINEGVSETYNKNGWLSNVFDIFWPF